MEPDREPESLLGIDADKSGISLAEKVASRVVDAVLAGEFSIGDQLPSEARIAEMAGVSRLTVREAIKHLVAKNVVRIERGKGTFVNSTLEWSPFDAELLAARAGASNEDRSLQSLLEVRLCIEPAAAALCALRCDNTHLAEVRDRLDEMRKSGDDAEAFANADLAFHQVIMRGSGNVFLAALMAPIEDLLRTVRYFTSLSSGTRQQACLEHEQIVNALQRRDGPGAETAMRAHLDRTLADFGQRTDRAELPSAHTSQGA